MFTLRPHICQEQIGLEMPVKGVEYREVCGNQIGNAVVGAFTAHPRRRRNMMNRYRLDSILDNMSICTRLLGRVGRFSQHAILNWQLSSDILELDDATPK